MDHRVFKDLLFMGGYITDASLLTETTAPPPPTGTQCDCDRTARTQKPKSRIGANGLTRLVSGVA